MGADGHFNDPDNSAENVLAGMPRHERRDSNSSITLGYPSTETDAKERKILEAFGMHSEAYLDYGNSSYARKPPRASVAPSPNSSMTSYSNPNSPAPRPQTEMGKMSRADRTASIWDIEATLREGRPVGACECSFMEALELDSPCLPCHLNSTSTTYAHHSRPLSASSRAYIATQQW